MLKVVVVVVVVVVVAAAVVAATVVVCWREIQQSILISLLLARLQGCALRRSHSYKRVPCRRNDLLLKKKVFHMGI